MAFADLDQDGFQDIALASVNLTGTQAAYISWLKGKGDGSFETAQTIPGIMSFGVTCNDPRSIAAPDLDGDGRPELAVLCYLNAPSVIYIARRHTNGSWNLQSNNTINQGGAANGTVMKWGRLTSTSGLDVVVAGLATTSTARIITGVSATVTNAATGSFTVAATPGTPLNLYGYISDVDIGDLNGDGYGDMVMSIQTQNGSTAQIGGAFYSCLSTGVAGTCNPQGWGMEGYQLTGTLIHDVNDDGLPDVFNGYRSNAAAETGMLYRTLGRTMNLSW